MRFLTITDFDKYQHYKDRRPPWIKLHVAVLEDYSFSCLQDASKLHLVLLWVLASKLENRIPYDLAWISRQIGIAAPITEADVQALIAKGFVSVEQDASEPLAERKQSAMPETETETETETENKKPSARAAKSKSEPGSDEPAPPGKPPSWVVEGADWWRANVGVISYPRFGKALTELVHAHGWPVVFEAVKCYADEGPDKQRGPKIEYFAAHAVKWLEWSKMPATDDNGDLTPRGKAIAGVVG